MKLLISYFIDQFLFSYKDFGLLNETENRSFLSSFSSLDSSNAQQIYMYAFFLHVYLKLQSTLALQSQFVQCQ